jgi:hypothetical protein
MNAPIRSRSKPAAGLLTRSPIPGYAVTFAHWQFMNDEVQSYEMRKRKSAP